MNKAIVIATTGPDLGFVRNAIETKLGIPLLPRESDYLGGVYLQGEAASLRIRVLENFADVDGELAEPEAPDCKILIRLEGEEADADALHARVEAIGLVQGVLRTKTY